MNLTAKDRDDFEIKLATALAPMLLAVGIFSLTLMHQQPNPTNTRVDEIFSFLSALYVIGSAFLADFALDKLKLPTAARLNYLQHGYLFFCLAVGTLTASIPTLYIERSTGAPTQLWRYLVFTAAGITVVIKLMTYEEKVWTVATYIVFVAAIIVCTIKI